MLFRFLVRRGAQLSKEEGLRLYKDMYMGRAFEDMCAQARGARGRSRGRDARGPEP
jgi:hypothetical protein